MRKKMSEYSLYRGRYVLGYTLAAVAVCSALLFAALYVPSGLHDGERAAVVRSATLQFQHFDPQTVIDLPYHLLQRSSIALFDITTLSTKIPSLIFGFLTIIAIYVLTATWFRKNVAIITTAIGGTLPVFLFASQDGTPIIYHFAVSFWLLVAATFVARRRGPTFLWKIIFFILLALNIYTPLGVYLDVAIISTIIFHPHIRFLTRKLNINRIAISSVIALVVLVPMIYSIVVLPKLLLNLLGIPTEWPTIIPNIVALGKDYFGFFSSGSSDMVRPMFSIGIFLVTALGLYRFILVKYTARSYVIWFWSLVVVPIIIMSPSFAVYIFPIVVIMIAMGIDLLIREWYKLFPYNPYARAAGLLPLGIIVGGLIITGVQMYGVSYHYLASTANRFDNDLERIDQALRLAGATKDKPALLLITQDRKTFYDVVARYDTRYTVTTALPSSSPQLPLLVSMPGANRPSITHTPTRIFTDSRLEQADRVYLYTVDQK
jgi:4-amino-4-deoxy-L-arabinose transferase-like glycosyltransferase